MKILGITGGMGSGKTLAARRMAEKGGVPLIDSDEIGRGAIAPGGAGEQAVRAAFGAAVLSCGKIDRGKLAARVFSDPAALKELNAMLHPLIAAEVRAQCARYAGAGHALALVEAALYGEQGERPAWLDGLILVLAPLETRVARLAAGRGMARTEILARIEAQCDPELKRPLADWIIENDGTEAELFAQVDEVLEAIRYES